MISTNFPISAETWLVPIYPISAEMLDTPFISITFFHSTKSKAAASIQGPDILRFNKISLLYGYHSKEGLGVWKEAQRQGEDRVTLQISP